MMKTLRTLILFFAVVGLFAVFLMHYRHSLPQPVQEAIGLSSDISDIRARQQPRLTATLGEIGATLGDPVYLRVFKEEAELELWVQTQSGFVLFKTYPICSYSGKLGPKLREGDHQAPEGFYQVKTRSLNPKSQYHLSFNLGFPNAYDRAQGRTGSFLMIHGACLSVGCYAMTDPLIEEIYVLVEAALKSGQDHVPVHAFPFHMTDKRLTQTANHKWHAFWQELRPAYDLFQTTGQVPRISVEGSLYQITTDQR